MTAGEGGNWRGRPPQVLVMVLLSSVGAALCLFGALRPATSSSPAVLDGTLAAVGLGLAGLLWWSPVCCRSALLHTAGMVHVIGTTMIVAEAATGEGALSTATSYIWVSMYAAVFFSRWVARAYAGSSAVGLALALSVNDAIISGLAAWIVLVVTVAVAAETLAVLLRRLHALASVDQLTGLHNRTALTAALAREQAVLARTGKPLSLAVIDVDNLKVVNDRDGHVAGDRLLTTMAREWQATVRPQDLLFRYGGDEFVLLLPGTSVAEAGVVLQRLRLASSASWSYGVAGMDPDDELEACLARADRLMYRQKATGRGGHSHSMVPGGLEVMS